MSKRDSNPPPPSDGTSARDTVLMQLQWLSRHCHKEAAIREQRDLAVVGDVLDCVFATLEETRDEMVFLFAVASFARRAAEARWLRRIHRRRGLLSRRARS